LWGLQHGSVQFNLHFFGGQHFGLHGLHGSRQSRGGHNSNGGRTDGLSGHLTQEMHQHPHLQYQETIWRHFPFRLTG